MQLGNGTWESTEFNSRLGHAHQDGIADLMLGRIIDDYDGGVINFSKNATLEQREKLKKTIEESPIVYKVYEHVVPSEIQDL
jgi:hypothetical protein